MTRPPSEEPDDKTELQLAALLAMFDEARRGQAGSDSASDPTGLLPPDAKRRFDRARQCLQLIERLRPRGTSPPRAWETADPAAQPPDLSAEELALLQLLREEMRLRQQTGTPTRPEEYLELFPQYAEHLRRHSGLPSESATEVTADAAHADSLPTEAAATGAAAQPWTAPRHFDDYEILEELGRGGMGVVYKARHKALKRLVALKMILAGAHAGPDHVGRFRTEAEAVARLQHPNIVQIYEAGEQDGRPYLALEYVAGVSLAEKLRASPLAPREAASLVETIARAIHFAHGRGIVHRDLKPSNVLLQTVERQESSVWGGTEPLARDAQSSTIDPKITDFGLAKLLEEEGHTKSGDLVGTASHMAPEQVSGQRQQVGPATDTYALGVILYESLTGRTPFRAATPIETIRLIVHEDPVPPSRLQPQLPRDLETVCMTCLQKEPARRYPTALALADDLHRFVVGEPVQARPVGRLERAWRWCRRKPVAATLALVSVVAGLSVPVSVTALTYNARLARSLDATRAAKEAESIARQRERRAAAKAEEFHYFNRIALASAEWRELRVGHAEKLLEQCPATFRHWEWHYLRRLCRGQRLTLAHPGTLLCVSVSPDDRFVAAAGHDGAVFIWNSDTGELARTLRGHTNAIYAVRFSPDGQRLVTASSDKSVRIWSAESGDEELRFDQHTNSVRAATFSPDGNWIASAGKDGRIKIWNPQSGTLRHDLDGIAGQDHSLAFSPDGATLAYGGGQVVKLLDALSGQNIRTLGPFEDLVRSVAFRGDGRHIAAASEDGSVRVWFVDTGDELLRIPAHHSKVYSVTFSSDGRWLATGSMDSTITIWDAATGQELRHLRGHAGRVYGVVFSPNSNRLISASTDRSVKIWDTGSDVEARVITAPAAIAGLAWSPNGRRIATVAPLDERVTLWNADTGSVEFSVAAGLALSGKVVFSPDGHCVAAAGTKHHAAVWNCDSATLTRLIGPDSHGALALAFSPDSRWLVTGSADRTARIWNAASGEEVLRFTEHLHDVQAVAFSPNGRWVASAGEDHTVKIWEAGSGRTMTSVSENVRVFRAVAWSPDGRRVAAANSNGVVQVWDAFTGETTLTLEGHTHGLTTLAWSPDGGRIASAGTDRLVLIWEADSGHQALALRGHSDTISTVAWSPDGHRLASASRDGTIRIWDATPLND